MSCHDIGRGLNEVVRMVISEYDKGGVSKDSAKKIISTCGVSVNWCDGNRYEALSYVRRCRCGSCLKLIPEGEKLFSLWNLPHEYRDEDIEEDEGLAADGLCESCFDNIIPKYCKGEDSVKSLKDEIIKYNSNKPNDYLSDGEHPGANNGYEWIRDTDC